MDVGKNMAARIGGIMKAPQKALVAVSRWQIWQYYSLEQWVGLRLKF